MLAVDLGKTGCRVALWADDDAPAAGRLQSPGAEGLATRGGVSAALAAVAPLARQLLGGGTPDLVGVGAAGAAADPEAAHALAAALGERLGAAHVAVTSDAVTSHAGALAGAAGVVLAAGTGAVAIAVRPDGASHRVDGWGPWLGDQGGGAAIGLAGLRAALRAVDGRGPATVLREEAAGRYGTDLSRLPGLIGAGGQPARDAAGFAPAVARAAVAGDAVAGAILARAAEELAETVATAVRRLDADAGPVPTALIGGALRLDGLAAALRAGLAASGLPLQLREPAGDGLDGARLLARRRDTVHEPAVTRHCPRPGTP